MDAETVTGIVPVLGGQSEQPAEPANQPSVASSPASPPDDAVARVATALKNIGAAADIETIAAEVNAGVAIDAYLATGVIKACLDVLASEASIVTRETSDSPPRTVYETTAPQEPAFVDRAEGLSVEARAAVATVLGGGRAYIALPDGTPAPEAEPETPLGGFDASQVAFVLAIAAQKDVRAPHIAIPATYVAGFMEGLDPTEPEPIEARATTILDALAATDPALVCARASDEASGEPGRTLFSLTSQGQVLFAERGAQALAEATMAPKPPQPSAEDRLAQLERSHLEYQKRLIEDHAFAIAQRDRALKSLADREKSLDLYRDWFERKKLADPDTIVAAQKAPERKIVQGYTLEMSLNIDEHFRIVRELGNADRSLSMLLEQQSGTVAEMKKEKIKAESRVAALKDLVKLPADGQKHVVVKDVYKLVEDGRIAVYSADTHDEGALVCYEQIPAGSQRVLAGTGVPEVPAEAPPRKKKEPKAEPPAEPVKTESATPTSAAEVPEEKPAPGQDTGPDYSGVIFTLLVQEGPMTAEAIAAKLKIAVSDVVRSIGASSGKIKQNGDRFEVPQPPKKAEKEPAAKRSTKRTSLDPETIDKNIHDLLGTEPYSRTGIKRESFGQAYCDFVDLKLTDSLERLIVLRLDIKIKGGSAAKGEGGDDVLVWRADLEDPRKTDADREIVPEEATTTSARRGRGPDKQPRKPRGKAGASE